MAISYSWGYTNTTSSLVDLTPVAVGLTSNYAVTVDDPGYCVCKNLTGPIDQRETISFRSRNINSVDQIEPNMHPPKMKNGRQLTVKLDAKKRATSSVDDTFIEDNPLSTTLVFYFPTNGSITASDLLDQAKRLVGALQDASSDGYIIDELMMEQLNPNR